CALPICQQVLPVVEVAHGDDLLDPLALLHLDQVDHGGAPGRPRRLGYLVDLAAVDHAAVAEEQQRVVVGGDEQLLHEVLVAGGEIGRASAAAADRKSTRLN